MSDEDLESGALGDGSPAMETAPAARPKVWVVAVISGPGRKVSVLLSNGAELEGLMEVETDVSVDSTPRYKLVGILAQRPAS